jgi:hypothetical protein
MQDEKATTENAASPAATTTSQEVASVTTVRGTAPPSTTTMKLAPVVSPLLVADVAKPTLGATVGEEAETVLDVLAFTAAYDPPAAAAATVASPSATTTASPLIQALRNLCRCFGWVRAPPPEVVEPPYHYLPQNASTHLRSVSNSWSPLRRGRESVKIRGLNSGPYRGGDIVLNSDGIATTVSFCFKVGSMAYGVTVGHLTPVIGEPVYAYTGEGTLVTQLGNVVSYSVKTDSLIFSIDKDIPIAEYQLGGKSILGDKPLVRPTPGEHKVHPQGTVLVGYGAQGRGVIGTVCNPALQPSLAKGYCNAGDIGISDPVTGAALTESGDCGTIFIDEEQKYGPSMHNILWTQDDGKFESFGVPLATIFANHELLGGTKDLTTAVKQIQQASFPGSQSHNLLQLEITFKDGGKQTHNLGKPMKLTFK